MASISIVSSGRNTTETIAAINAAKVGNSAVVGFEILEDQVREHLTENFDPQHAGGRSDISAVAEVLQDADRIRAAYGHQHVVLVLPSKVDVDALAALCVFRMVAEGSLRYRDGVPEEGETEFPHLDEPGLEARVGAIDAHDRYADGLLANWQPVAVEASMEKQRPLGAVLLLASDFTVPAAVKVDMMSAWLRYGTEPVYQPAVKDGKTPPAVDFRKKWESARADILGSIADGTTTFEVVSVPGKETKIVVVRSPKQGGLLAGYSRGPVVVAVSTDPRLAGLVTIAQPRLGYVDLKAVMAALNKSDPTVDLANKISWGPGTTILACPKKDGKPIDGGLAVAVIVDLVGQHLLA